MDASDLARSAKAWHDRLTGRVAFDPSAAETVVRRVYRAAELPEPSQILWATGPREAAQAIAFVESPPGRLRFRALAVLVIGAAASTGLAFSAHSSTFAAQTPTTAAIWSAVFAAAGLTLGIVPRIPLPPGLPAIGRYGKLIFMGATFFIALAGYIFALLRLGGLPIDPLGRGAVLTLAAAVGTLPGALLFSRMRRAYAHLPRFLRELAPSPSVAHALERARWKYWPSSQRTANGPRPHESLLQAHRSVHREALVQPRTSVLHSNNLTQASRAVSWTGSRWIAADALVDAHAPPVFPPHLDGIEDAARAAATRADAGGEASSFADLAFHVDRLYPFAAIAVAVEPATTVALDAEGRPHAEDGPALAWADGTRIFAWHGRLVPPDVLDRERPITRSRIDREADPERRWVLIERYGLGRYLLEVGAAEIERDDCGRLYRFAPRFSEPILAVRVVNHTPEPDGSLHEFWLSVPPTMTTAREAVAWTFGLTTEEYDPVAQS